MGKGSDAGIREIEFVGGPKDGDIKTFPVGAIKPVWLFARYNMDIDQAMVKKDNDIKPILHVNRIITGRYQLGRFQPQARWNHFMQKWVTPVTEMVYFWEGEVIE